MAAKAFSPEEVFSDSELIPKIIGYFNQELKQGRRIFNDSDTIPDSFLSPSAHNMGGMVVLKKLSDVLPLDFKRRLIAQFENPGWKVESEAGQLIFSEKDVVVVRPEKEVLITTQLTTNLMIFLNEQLQNGVRVINQKLLEENLEKLTVGLDVKLEKVDDLNQFFPIKPDKSFERLLEAAGWKLTFLDGGGITLSCGQE